MHIEEDGAIALAQGGPVDALERAADAVQHASRDVPEIVLNGHDHDYERFGPQKPDGASDPSGGIREFVVGTGGDSLYAFLPPKSNSQARNVETFGVLKLTLHPETYEWRFVPEAGKTFTDSGTDSCH